LGLLESRDIGFLGLFKGREKTLVSNRKPVVMPWSTAGNIASPIATPNSIISREGPLVLGGDRLEKGFDVLVGNLLILPLE